MRKRGMTLVELLIAMSLSLILVGTAAFVFIQAQKIMGRVDTRLRGAQAFRVTSTLLDQDGARLENAAALVNGTPSLKTITTTGKAWFTVTAGTQTDPDKRLDSVSFITHAQVSLLDAAKTNTLPPADTTVLVTYKIRPNRGLVRELSPCTIGSTGGVPTATPDDTLLPSNQNVATPGPLIVDLAPGATGFNVRFCLGGLWVPADSNSATGTTFKTAMPSGLEFTVYIPETNLPDSTRLSLVRTVELCSPPP